MVPIAILAAVVVQPEETHAAGRDELLFQEPIEVITDLIWGRPFVEPGVGPRLVDSVLTKWPRGDSIDRGRLVKPDERIGVEPVPARPVAAVHHDDACVGFRQ